MVDDSVKICADGWFIVVYHYYAQQTHCLKPIWYAPTQAMDMSNLILV
jgi:hypothetical protein